MLFLLICYVLLFHCTALFTSSSLLYHAYSVLPILTSVLFKQQITGSFIMMKQPPNKAKTVLSLRRLPLGHLFLLLLLPLLLLLLLMMLTMCNNANISRPITTHQKPIIQLRPFFLLHLLSQEIHFSAVTNHLPHHIHALLLFLKPPLFYFSPFYSSPPEGNPLSKN